MTDMENVSGVILAGGLSSRMGSNKAELPFGGVTLLEHQISKLRCLGIEDIVVAGHVAPLPDIRFAADVFPQKGPLGGIHAGLCAARGEHCLVLSVDTPLLPAELLLALVREHIKAQSSITVLAHGDKIEPLIAVYEKSLAPLAEEILRTDSTSVRELYKRREISQLAYTGDERLLCDCNTPEEYRKATELN